MLAQTKLRLDPDKLADHVLTLPIVPSSQTWDWTERPDSVVSRFEWWLHNVNAYVGAHDRIVFREKHR